MTNRHALTLGLALVFLPIAACSDILDVHVPGRVQEEALNDPALAPTMVASVVSDFECAWNNYVAAAALIGDEFIQASGNLNQRNWASRRDHGGRCRHGAGKLPHPVRHLHDAADGAVPGRGFVQSPRQVHRRAGGEPDAPQGDGEGVRRVRAARTRRRLLRDGDRWRTTHDAEGSARRSPRHASQRQSRSRQRRTTRTF